MKSIDGSRFRNSDCEVAVFQSLAADYAAREIAADSIDDRVAALKQKSQQRPSTVLNCELELLILRRCSESELRQRVSELRQQWAVLSQRPAAAQNPEPQNHEQLLAEARFLTLQTFRQRELQEAFARTKWLVVGWNVIPVVIAVTAVWVFVQYSPRDPTIAVIVSAGICGGFVSSCRRLLQLEPGPDILATCKLLRSDVTRLIVKPILGAVFAFALYLLFISQMITGTLFPRIEVVGSSLPFTGTALAIAGDFTKLLVWGFIAGFSEQFVPDILDRFSIKASRAVAGGKE